MWEIDCSYRTGGSVTSLEAVAIIWVREDSVGEVREKWMEADQQDLGTNEYRK